LGPGSGILCGSGTKKNKRPQLYKSNAKFITCYRCIKLVKGRGQRHGHRMVARGNPGRRGWTEIPKDNLIGRGERQARWVLYVQGRYFGIIPQTIREMYPPREEWPEGRRPEVSLRHGFQVVEVPIDLQGRAAQPIDHGWVEDLDTAFEIAEAHLKDLERLALEAPSVYAEENPLHWSVFSPSYEALSQEEYDEYVFSDASKRWEHVQVQGGRRAARFGEYGPYPRDPKKGGPRREGSKIVGGKASPRDPEIATRTKKRLGRRTPPWESRTQSPIVWAQTLQRMGFDLGEELERELRDVRRLYPLPEEAKENPRSLYKRLYGKRVPRKVQKLAAEIEAALYTYRATPLGGGSDGLAVPLFAGPLMDAGVPKDVAYELVRRAGGRFIGEDPSLPPPKAPATLAEALTEELGGVPILTFVGSDAVIQIRRAQDRERVGHIERIDVELVSEQGKRGPFTLATADGIAEGFSRFVAEKRKGEGYAPSDQPLFVDDVLESVHKSARDRADRADDRNFFVFFSRLKDPVLVALPSLWHPDAPEEPDIEARLRYRTLENIPLAYLPTLLARISLRTKREGRNLQPLSTSDSLENPMSYWEKQYSQGPYGSSRSVPPARRNRGRPRKGGRTNLAPPPDNEFVRMTAAQLKRSKKPGAKKELERRAILRGDSTTKRARGRKDKVTKAGKVSTWQAFMHENAGKGWSIQRMSREYKKAMKTGKSPSSASGRKVKASKPKTQKSTNGRKTTWPKFRSHAAKRGYTPTQASSKWKQYKAGKGTIASLLPPKKKSKKNPAKRRRDTTHTREALVPAGYDYWDNSVPTALKNRGDQRRGSLASDPWHPVYEQMIGQFSTGEGWSSGEQPVNRRNNPKKRKARKNGKRRANPDAKRAMQLYHSGEADSLGEAWDMVRNGY
jgi:hypothetical protein